MISQKALSEFKEIYRKEFGVEINDEEAQERGIKLLQFFNLIYRPIPRSWLKQNVKSKKGSKSKK